MVSNPKSRILAFITSDRFFLREWHQLYIDIGSGLTFQMQPS